MKKLNYLLAAVAVMAMAGCAKEKDVTPASNVVTLRATVENTDTRVSIDNAYAYAFQSGDMISVALASEGMVDFEAAAGGTTVSFDGTLESGQAVGNYAFYPAASDYHEVMQLPEEDVISFYMNEMLTWKADESFMPMLGKILNGTISFKAVGGVLKLIVYNIPSGAAYLQFTTNDKRISGYYGVENVSSDAPVIETGGNYGGSDDTVFIDFTGNYSPNMVFYIPLPTGTIDGFTLTFQDSNFNDISGATKSTSANLNVTRNKIIIAPALNMAQTTNVVLWSEDWESYSANDVPDGAEGEGYNGAQITYTCTDGNDGTITAIKDDNVVAGSGANNKNLLVSKAKSSNSVYGTFTASNIPTSGASSAVLSFDTNNSSANRWMITTTTQGVTIGAKSSTGSSPTTLSYPISIANGVSSFDLVFTNSSTSNARIDNILLEATIGASPTTPSIITMNGETATIGAGNQRASINGIKLQNPLDNLGISATTTADWLTLSFTEGSFETGAKLTATATSYNHDPEARSATVTLKATGATKTVTFTQNPSLVPNPTTLTAAPGDKTFSVSWTGDSKAASYVAYYSTSDLSSGNPATSGTAMTVTKEGNTYTAVPEETLANRTTYYVYVKVGSVAENYSAYGISAGWASTTVVPVGEVVVETVTAPYSQMFKANGQGKFVQDIVNDGGMGTDIWSYDSQYGMVAYGKVGNTNYNTEADLLSPKIVIPSTMISPMLSFKHVGNYFTNTTNMKADVPIYIREEGGNWIQLNVTYPDGSSWTPWTTVNYSLTNYKGKTVQFKWHYTSTTSRCGKYELDEFDVFDTGNLMVTYTVSSTTAVTTSGDAPSGSTASYSSTYGTKCQLTAGKSMTLTLSGFAGKKIKGLTLSMKSNASSGSGYMYMATKNGTTLTNFATIGSSANPLAFSNNAWHGSWSTSYVDVTVPVTETTVATGEDVVIYIEAKTNSLYCQSFTLTYE